MAIRVAALAEWLEGEVLGNETLLIDRAQSLGKAGPGSVAFFSATRATGLGLGYNIGVTLFGGMGPVIMASLGGFAFIGDLAPGYYLTLVCLLSLVTLITIRRTSAAPQGA